MSVGVCLLVMAVFAAAVMLYERNAPIRWWLSVPAAWLAGRCTHTRPQFGVIVAFLLLIALIWALGAIRFRYAWFVSVVLAVPTTIRGGPTLNQSFAWVASCWVLGTGLAQVYSTALYPKEIANDLGDRLVEIETRSVALLSATLIALLLGFADLANVAAEQERYVEHRLGPLTS